MDGCPHVVAEGFTSRSDRRAQGLHFLIWKAETVRLFWHRRLKWVGLK
jgi:hypothetical protein